MEPQGKNPKRLKAALLIGLGVVFLYSPLWFFGLFFILFGLGFLLASA